jgi:serine/threonine-protein kinase RsbW
MTDRSATDTAATGASGPPQLITLTLPLALRHAATARMVAASLAADAGFSVDEIDDLRLGINEVVSVLADEADADGSTRLTIEFHVGAGRVEATVARTDGAGVTELDELAGRILDAVVDDYQFSRGGFRLTKTATRPDDAD